MKALRKCKQVSESFWWVGEIFECWHCESRFKLEKKDKPKKTEQRFNDKDLLDSTAWCIKCPACKKINVIRSFAH